MIGTLAISGYRSLRHLVLPLDRLNLVTGANGSGKSSLYRALRLLGDEALNSVVSSLAREGGLASTLWAGPETIGRAVRRGDYRVEPTASRKTVSLKLGFAGETYGYSIDLGYPPPATTALASIQPLSGSASGMTVCTGKLPFWSTAATAMSPFHLSAGKNRSR
jgi:predicted ATPase